MLLQKRAKTMVVMKMMMTNGIVGICAFASLFIIIFNCGHIFW